MIEMIWSPKFKKVAEKFIKFNPEMIESFKSTIKLLEENPFNPSLKTHKLKGNLSDCFACSINYYYRIVFKMCIREPNCIQLLNIGTHEEVY